jgi:hypothetical protein
MAWRELVHALMQYKESIMQDENEIRLGEVVFVSFTAKGRKVAEPIFRAISQEF